LLHALACRVLLDGRPLNWQTSGILDRSFYNFFDFESGFTPGRHTLRFEMGSAPAPGAPIRQLCSLTLHEYAPEPAFHFDNSWISAYVTTPGAFFAFFL
jgi:hypothetical protein